MTLKLATVLSLMLFSVFLFAQTEEDSVDFQVSHPLILNKEIQAAYEWLTPVEFKKRKTFLTDLDKVSDFAPTNNQIIASKVAFVSEQTFDQLSYERMNNVSYISLMLNPASISKKSSDSWFITSRVKAYGVPFNMSFELKFKELAVSTLPSQTLEYFRLQASGPGRERFLLLDMTDFSQLIYRNYGLVFIKELNSRETIVISTIVSGIDLHRANKFFNFPPFSRTEKVMLKNIRNQVLYMAKSIQKIL